MDIIEKPAEELAPAETSGDKQHHRSSDRAIRSFVTSMAAECPYFLDDEPLLTDPKVDPRTLLARIINAIEYTPSMLAVLADQNGLIRKGFLVDTDIPQLTLRIMTEHCSNAMLQELAGKVREHEASLVGLLTEPGPAAEPAAAAAVPERKTAIVNDEMLGRIEIDCDTAAVIRVVPDTDAVGDVLVDDARQVEVNLDAETAKQSRVWGSW